MAATFSSVTEVPVGAKLKLIFGTVTLANPHAAGGDVADMSSYFDNAVYGAMAIDDCDGYQIDYVRAASGAVATGKFHARKWDGNAGVAVTAAGDNLAAVAFTFMAAGY